MFGKHNKIRSEREVSAETTGSAETNPWEKTMADVRPFGVPEHERNTNTIRFQPEDLRSTDKVLECLESMAPALSY